ncbi:hypothetical protein Pla100_10080 [Neorhodopirellula pilleata]|uniref:Uncharacterized protein n=2 Tax=Neorhodopirellula pilleata TaxID=2714738 RepID=A0A5C6AY87_9BACT|nr:hypothetical protein Pla100_10080 [Neorhodopirellula pilleata]
MKRISAVNRVGVWSVAFLVVAFARPASAQLPPLSQPVPAGGAAENAGGAGGGSLADFDSLMTLIQQTIEPDTWEALGGVGTMAPYPAGVLVDGEGLVRDRTERPESFDDPADTIARMLATDADRQPDANADDWRSPARVRCVSLRRMMQRLAAVAISGKEIAADDPLRFMAGLTRVEVLIVTPDDVILAGQVRGFDEVGGWIVDVETRLPTMSLVSLAVGLTASRSNTAFGCTIDPSTEGLQAAAAFGQRLVTGEIPMVTAADQLAKSLGRQAITVFGTAADHEVAYVMVEADRHMKRLALGDEPMPVGVRNYLQTIASTGDGTPPSDLLLRLWFTSKSLHLRQTEVESNQVVQIAGTPIKLSGQNELALQTGQRGNVVVDPATIAFVDHFNQNWMSIRSQYPIYGALESLYASTAIAELWKRKANTGDHETLQRAAMYFAAQQAKKLTPPREVDSIAVFHRYKRGRKLHQVLLASGGVKVTPQELIPMRSDAYAGLKSVAKLADQRPDDRWWWNSVAE